MNRFEFSDDNKRYHTYNYYLKHRFGQKVFKVPLNVDLGCPNRDGTKGVGGCIFCSAKMSGDFAGNPWDDIETQFNQIRAKMHNKWQEGLYIPYFQAGSNTYSDVETLKRMYETALSFENVVGLSIATRADCLPPDVVAYLAELSTRTVLTVELGLQTIHEETARYIRRGYESAVYFDAVKRLKAAGIEVVTHIILGLPGETPEMMVQTTKAAVRAGTDGVKFHLLHVLKNTDLAKDYEAGKFDCLSLEAYGEILKACIRCLPETVIVHRITGDGAKKDLIAPLWSGDKKQVLNYLQKLLNAE